VEEEIFLSKTMFLTKSWTTNSRVLIFWDITPCSQLEVNRRFGGECRLHLQEARINQARNQHEAGSKQSSDGGHVFFPNVCCLSEDYMASYSRRQDSSQLL
jgi:hypothetical protein